MIASSTSSLDFPEKIVVSEGHVAGQDSQFGLAIGCDEFVLGYPQRQAGLTISEIAGGSPKNYHVLLTFRIPKPDRETQHRVSVGDQKLSICLLDIQASCVFPHPVINDTSETIANILSTGHLGDHREDST